MLLLLTSREVKEWVDAKLNKAGGVITAFAKACLDEEVPGCFHLQPEAGQENGQYALNYYARSGRGACELCRPLKKNISNSCN